MKLVVSRQTAQPIPTSLTMQQTIKHSVRGPLTKRMLTAQLQPE